MSPKDRNRKAGRAVGELAPFAYTDGAARQTLYLAAWLLEDYRTDQELAERLAHVADELIPNAFPAFERASRRFKLRPRQRAAP